MSKDMRTDRQVVRTAATSLARLEGSLDALRDRGALSRTKFAGALEAMHHELDRLAAQVRRAKGGQA